MRRRRFSLRLRWALPGRALVVAGAVLAGTVLASAAAPALPRQTPAQLIAGLRHARLPAAMTATVSESANLGLPALPNIGGLSASPMSPGSLLSGTHIIPIWDAGPRHVWIPLAAPCGDQNFPHNRPQRWLVRNPTPNGTPS